MALRQCAICRDYFPEPSIRMKTGGWHHEDCSYYIPRSDLELKMEREMRLFKESHPLFFANLTIAKTNATNIPVEVKK